MDGSLVQKSLRVFPTIDSPDVFQEMAIRHMRGGAPVVTLLRASVSQGTGRKPLPAMLPTTHTGKAHPHEGVGLV
jgi:hypothetical protein